MATLSSYTQIPRIINVTMVYLHPHKQGLHTDVEAWEHEQLTSKSAPFVQVQVNHGQIHYPGYLSI
jgi:hypothetical protein